MCNEIENTSIIGFSDEFSYNNQAIKYEITTDSKLRLYVEDCAIALGVVDRKKLKDGSISVTPRWNRVYEDLVAIDKIANVGDFKKLDKDRKKELRETMKVMTISESDLYNWSFRVDTENGKLFREWLATIVLPTLRQYGIYVTGMENMTPAEIEFTVQERTEAYILRKYGIGIRKELTDTIKRIVAPRPEEYIVYAIDTNIVYETLFGLSCHDYKMSRGIPEKKNLRDWLKENNETELLNEITKAEDFLGNLIQANITDYDQLRGLLSNWNMANN